MITIEEMMSHPVFKHFTLITDRSGLNNHVRAAALFECETGESLDRGFHPGDMVITTLSAYRNAPELLEPVLTALLKKRLAALCIRTTYFHRLPDAVIGAANRLHTPIFFFSETPIVDLVYVIRSSLTAGEINVSATRKARQLISGNVSGVEAEMIAREINPYFHNELVCAFALPRSRDDSDQILSDYASQYYRRVSTSGLPPEASHTVMQTAHGFLIIYTDSRGRDAVLRGIRELRELIHIDPAVFALGLSNYHTQLSTAGTAMQEALYAAVVSSIDRTEYSFYRDIGTAKFLCPLRRSHWVRACYGELLNRVQTHDREHGTAYCKTMRAYVHCRGDIKATAARLYQHSNTVRYRIARIRELLGIEDAIDAEMQMFLIVRLEEINHAMHNLQDGACQDAADGRAEPRPDAADGRAEPRPDAADGRIEPRPDAAAANRADRGPDAADGRAGRRRDERDGEAGLRAAAKAGSRPPGRASVD
ncbi:MAG: PucR family transcriptional regulator [Anaerovoracaceae bacterium]|jgi:hypothetical protein